jgi:hypothetical protein
MTNLNKHEQYLKDVLLSSIAQHRGMYWSEQGGLVDTEYNELITEDSHEIAKKLLGQTATYKDLNSYESIIDYIIKLPKYELLIAEARMVLAEENIELPYADTIESYQPGTNAWFRKLIGLVNF